MHGVYVTSVADVHKRQYVRSFKQEFALRLHALMSTVHRNECNPTSDAASSSNYTSMC